MIYVKKKLPNKDPMQLIEPKVDKKKNPFIYFLFCLYFSMKKINSPTHEACSLFSAPSIKCDFVSDVNTDNPEEGQPTIEPKLTKMILAMNIKRTHFLLIFAN